MAAHRDPRQRREELFRIHSTIRSADSLRPDEAFDELAKLYQVWDELGSCDVDESVTKRFGISLSPTAIESILPKLWDLLSNAEVGLGGDLFQELAAVGVRSGLGQYFTPHPVAEAMADFLAPKPGEHWLDPFLGSGLLLGALAVAAQGPIELHGSDLDRRVLRLASLEAKLRHPQSPLSTAHISALEEPSKVLDAVAAPPDGVDGIVTNPPFGAVDINGSGDEGFELAIGRKTPIEVLGLEQSLRLLRPGGRLGIVLPQSVLSNKRLQHVREFLRTRTQIDGVLSLPGETFALFEGVGKASIAFVTKAPPASAQVWFGRATSIGWDGTGRMAGQADVRETAIAMRERRVIAGRVESKPLAESVDRNITAEWQLRRIGTGILLSDLTSTIFTGKTPARAQYADREEGGAVRAVKVANLTGHGINWAEGERSFAVLPRAPQDKMLALGDIVLTAAAHHPRYIAAKVDVVDEFPEGWADRCLPTGEVLVIRAIPEAVDTVALLLWLRSAEGRSALQACVTGQTAHLHPEYVREVRVPKVVTAGDMSSPTELLRRSLQSRRQAEQLQAAATAEFASRAALEAA